MKGDIPSLLTNYYRLGLPQHGWTPLHRAAETGSLECMKLLIQHGANVDAGTVVGVEEWESVLLVRFNHGIDRDLTACLIAMS